MCCFLVSAFWGRLACYAYAVAFWGLAVLAQCFCFFEEVGGGFANDVGAGLGDACGFYSSQSKITFI